MSSALFPLALAAGGLPVIVGGVALVARRLVETHADQTAAEIRAEFARTATPTRRLPERRKELVR